ncbi:rhomboid family intramembrane serine protease [Granulicoccus sp. GXG6511]|uniref:rhomboid family intramembrane serine protease n=1 Tax=Granulicoccus sp. GXG6511 TaxID=3381351 RepID=UPI003D7C857D
MSDDRPDFTWDEFAGKDRGESAPRDADRFKPCFRHSERTTGINCQRCDRPICGECMVPASVGFQCPVCVAEQQMAARPVTNRVGKRVGGGSRGGRSLAGIKLSGGPASTTVVVMILIGVVGLVDLVARGAGAGLLGYVGPGVMAGHLWRLVTGLLVSGSLFNTAICLLFLWLVGRSVEGELGRGRMLAVLVLAGLGGSTALMLFMPTYEFIVPLAYASILGMLAAVAAMKYRFGEDIKGDLILLGLMVAFSVVMGYVPGWISQLGAIAAGAGAGAVLAYAPRENRGRWQTIGLVGIAAGCLLLIGVRFLL